MNRSIEKLRIQIARKGKEAPAYAPILELYRNIKEAQEAASPAPDFTVPEVSGNLKALQAKEGFPLIGREDFVIDSDSAAALFEALCRHAKNATEKMRANVGAIEDALSVNALSLKELLRRYADEPYLRRVAEQFDIEESVLGFLTMMSVQPSMRRNVERLQGEIEPEKWLRGYCPVCGSPPGMSELRGDGRRYFMCSFCGFEWPGARLKCPFCENANSKELHYFYEENEESHRVDMCDHCRKYIKTVDARKMDYEPDLVLEDITTVHLDILASEKGYIRPVPSPWGL